MKIAKVQEAPSNAKKAENGSVDIDMHWKRLELETRLLGVTY